MSCDDYRNKISEYIDGELGLEATMELLKHTEECPSCLSELNELKVITEMLKETKEEELPDNFHNEVMSLIRPAPKKRKVGWAKYTGIAASICALFIVGGVLFTGANSMKNSADAASGGGYNTATKKMYVENDFDKYEAPSENSVEAEAPMMVAETEEAGGALAIEDISIKINTIDNGRKIIKTGSINITVESFDDTINKLKNYVSSSGGYIENYYSNIYMVDYINNKEEELKEGSIILKVPSTLYGSSFDFVKTLGDLNSENETTSDITNSYIDTKSRLVSKQTEETRLIELLGKAQSVEEIIAIEGRLSEVRGEITSYAEQLKAWDSLVDFSTIDVFIREERTPNVTPISEDLGSRVKKSFVNSINNFVRGIEGLIVGVAGSVIGVGAFIISAIILFLIIRFIVRLIIKRYKNKKLKSS